MPSFADSIFLFVLALLLFGPKRLPVLARELGKWMGEFRRASNEFKMQMEDELRASEQADRKKQIPAMEAAAPVPPPLGEPAEPEHPHLRHNSPTTSETLPASPLAEANPPEEPAQTPPAQEALAGSPANGDSEPLPIATSGSLRMMPPATGLPTPRTARTDTSETSPLADLVHAIPETPHANGNGASAGIPLTGEEVTHAD